MSKKKLTKADLGKTLAELGFKEGDEITLPSKKPKTNDDNETQDDTGGSQPPPGKDRP